MQMIIENIGMIKKADIFLEGLTVIAGENDTGKSTIGKLVFSMIKGVNNYERYADLSKSNLFRKKVESFYYEFRKFSNQNKDDFSIHFRPRSFTLELKNLNVQESKLFFTRKKEEIKKVSFGDRLPVILEKFQEIEDYFFQSEQSDVLIKEQFEKIFFSEFEGELSPKWAGEQKGQIDLFEGQYHLVKLELFENRINHLTLHDDLFFNEATFVESSMGLQLNELANRAVTVFDDPANYTGVRVPLHVKDLWDKINLVSHFNYYQQSFLLEQFDKEINTVTETIKGEGVFKESSNSALSFYKNEQLHFKVSNTASGIKIFALLQILLRISILNERSLLILDEPENNLHPKWQVEYAKLIVSLVKKGVSVLLTSHSPYLIQAINVFSAKANLQDKTYYYLATKDETTMTSTFEDVTGDLNQVFVKLSEPLNDLVWMK